MRWTAMETPPARMRKGFGESLSRALKTTRQTLFVDYVKVRPEEATNQWVFAFDNAPWLQPDWRDRPDEEKLKSLMFSVGRENLRLLVQWAEVMAHARAAQQLKGEEDAVLSGVTNFDLPTLPPLPPHMTPEAIKARRPKRKKS